ncbi:hypothetical protein HMPREF1074_04491 [Bacteroides xylanisolvens CL03T12C04]|uniref:DUF3945 domain-containing protein n=3 Tax=Bacteroides xylanisolvens TaxID=371601 RepID=I9A8F8_9BACE|nr:DUF3945 domain-containing protein [Bacteroides xylanisolvens]EIY84060.1 hypothetical protein HMPREF1074_04491 [Bacteroides xylanisolvens CL03T12C04]MBT0704420.1 Protein of unknown function (DUF3945) [Bacteroides xylanisolvens CL03T12C04]
MAQKKDMEEKPKRARKSKVKSNALPVEQINELMFIHNKNDPQTGVQAVSGIDEKGKVQTVPADERNENSFLKFEKNSSILENFIKNFWSQLKEPTHFRLIRMTIHDYKQNKQAIKELSQGKETDTVKEFLKRYEIRPRENRKQSKNEKEKETMAKKQTPQEKAQQPVQTPQTQEQQAPRYRYNENMVNWEALEKIGVSKASLEQQGLLDSMLKGYKTNKLVPLTLTLTSAKVKLDARLSFIAMPDGQIGLGIHGIRKEPELERPYFGHIFTEEDKKHLRETGNMGRVAELNLNGGAYTPCLISIDKNTNELVAVRQENVYIPNEVKGIKLTADEINALKEGKPVYVDGMTSKNGKPFDATLQYSAERRGLEFIYPESQGFNQQSLGGIQLSPSQIKMLSEGHTILVEDMKRTDGALFSSFVTLDKVTGRPQYTRHNPENGEIYIPKEICNVQLTPEDKEALRKGQPVFLENMINRKGEEFSSFVKLDMNTGRPQYSRTPDGFSERQAPIVPAEVYGHVFTAQERANLQNGKAILVSDLKSANNKTFSSYLKVNANSGQLQYFQENPDIRRNTTRRTAQTDDMQNRQQEQKKASRQAV